MKKYIISIFFLFFIYNLQSQVLIALILGDKLNNGKMEFGLDGGLNFSSISELEANKWKRDFNLGFYFDIKMKKQWYFNTGVLVKSSLGVDNLSETDLNEIGTNLEITQLGDYTQKISYFLVPTLAKYRFKNNLYVEAGPQFGLMYKAWLEHNFNDEEGNENRIREENKDAVNRMEVGAVAGVGYRLLEGLGWTIGVRYHYGLTNVYKNISSIKNHALFLKLNIPIGVSEAKKEEIKEVKDQKQKEKEKKKKSKKQKN
ncbi:PorT family protein [Flavobacteriaceae bacterium]|nr:PorT family protein [Flavobacteriaceae bacterium]MDA9025672.1 PorT family protein [bacterium]|tara:strand:- start:446 stop:1219 length:774 start_codon:yes stop_codon:yes gene_type:complete